MKLTTHADFKKSETFLMSCLQNFKTSGSDFIIGKRNQIKLFDLDDITLLNIKSFKKPNLINKIAYKFFRKSKAKRSFEYANSLSLLGIGTPKPIAYAENFDFIGLEKSYYISQHLNADLTFRELVEIPDYPNHDIILRQFSQFCFKLHEKGVEFLDHSPGNTLIKKVSENKYDFFLVDLNRMNFHASMPFEMRMKNLSRLTPKKEMVAVMSNEYATLYSSKSESEIFEKMWFYTNDFQIKFHKKIAIKKKLKF